MNATEYNRMDDYAAGVVHKEYTGAANGRAYAKIVVAPVELRKLIIDAYRAGYERGSTYLEDYEQKTLPFADGSGAARPVSPIDHASGR
jgi:hypothetical protein